jgi:hypothetical protein
MRLCVFVAGHAFLSYPYHPLNSARVRLRFDHVYETILPGEQSIYDTPHMTLLFLTFNVGVLAAQV